MTTRILLVEDDARLRAQLVPSLRDAGYRCEIARTVAEGKLAYTKARPDLLLLDLTLPDGSGQEILREVREDSLVPVIVITAKTMGPDKVATLDLGADDYITKPFWFEELHARIRAVLRRQPAPQPRGQEIDLGDLVIDLSSRAVRVADQAVHLTPSEFDTLRYLAEHPDEALRRERIVEAVLRSEDAATEALQTQISRLRKKLGAAGQRIQTVWGIGYKWVTREVVA